MLLRKTEPESWPHFSVFRRAAHLLLILNRSLRENTLAVQILQNNNKQVLFTHASVLTNEDSPEDEVKTRETTRSYLQQSWRPLHGISSPPVLPGLGSSSDKGSRAGFQDLWKEGRQRPGPQAFVSFSRHWGRGCEGCAPPPTPHARFHPQAAGSPSWQGASRSASGFSLGIITMSVGALLVLLNNIYRFCLYILAK